MNPIDAQRRGRKRLASEIQRICPTEHKEEPAEETPLRQASMSALDSLLSKRLSEEASSGGASSAELDRLRSDLRREIRAVDERLSRQLEEVSRKLDAHIGICSLLQTNGAAQATLASVLPTATLPLSLPLPKDPSPRNSPKFEPADSPAAGWSGRSSSAMDGAKVSPFSGNDSATSDGSSGSGGAGQASLLNASLPPLAVRPPQRRTQAKDAPRPLVMTDYAKYVGDGSDPLVFPPEEEAERWRKLEDAGTTPQLPTSYCWSMLRGRLGVEGLVHPSLSKSEACPPNSSLTDLLRRQSNVIAQALALTLRRYSKPDASEADTRQLARNIMRQVIKNVNTLRTSYKHVAMRQQYEADLDQMGNVASAFQKLRQQYFTQQGFSLS